MPRSWVVQVGFGILAMISPQALALPAGIPPQSGEPDWMAEGEQENEIFGECVAGAGDVNGDGYPDILIGAPQYSGHNSEEGRMLLFLGSPAGPLAHASWQEKGGQSIAHLGWSQQSAGDVDGDGFDDVIVGNSGYDGAFYNQGRALLYRGSAGGLAEQPSWIVEGLDTADLFGWRVAGAGDVNADHYDDVLVSAAGRVLAYLGSSSGLSYQADWIVGVGGYSVAGAGDVNGDGYDDVILGQLGTAFVFLGSAQGLGLQPDWTAQNAGSFGWSVGSAGDVNADGYDDIVVGAKDYYTSGAGIAGAAFVFHGSATGVSPTPNWFREGESYQGSLGWSVACAGDVNADSYADVILGDPDHSHGQSHEGRAYLFLGSAAGLEQAAAWIGEGGSDAALFGESVASAGDVNGTGRADLLIGASGYFVGGVPFVGRAYLYQDVICSTVGEIYCTSTTNSTGYSAQISAACSANSSEAALKLKATLVPNAFGLFFHGGQSAELPFGNGYLCIAGDAVRGEVLRATSLLATYVYDGSNQQHDLSLYIGTTRHFHYWFRDTQAGGARFNTSNGVKVAILP